jgi:thiol-disulfide isomerase/thioredoxin
VTVYRADSHDMQIAARAPRALLVSAVLGLLMAGGAAWAEAGFDPAAHPGKVVIVDFWASWCVPCRRSFPWLNAMHERYADAGLVIVGVNLDQDRSAASEFLREYPAKFTIVYDGGEELAKDFDVVAMPSSYLIGRDGKLRRRHFGFKVKQQQEYEAAITEALADQE